VSISFYQLLLTPYFYYMPLLQFLFCLRRRLPRLMILRGWIPCQRQRDLWWVLVLVLRIKMLWELGRVPLVPVHRRVPWSVPELTVSWILNVNLLDVTAPSLFWAASSFLASAAALFWAASFVRVK
jgi:hypothetical protein